MYVKIINELDETTKNHLINLCMEIKLDNGEKRVIRKLIGIK